MTYYKHTQTGYLMLVILLILVAFYTWLYKIILAEGGFDSAIISATVAMVLILFILASFSTLTVTADENYLKIKFGYGIFQRRFSFAEIASVKIVKNHWYYGWGIRLWLWPKMWIYNISGFDAIKIIMKDGGVYRVGTDEPKKLEQAITQQLKNR